MTTLDTSAASGSGIVRHVWRIRIRGSLVLTIPAGLLLLFVVGIPFLMSLRATFGTGLGSSATGWTVGNYSTFFKSETSLVTLGNTALVAALSAAIALVLGYPLALYMSFGADRIRRLVTLALIAPLVISGVVRADGMSFLYSPGNPIDKALSIFPGDHTLDLLDTQAGVILGLAYYGLPFTIITLASSFSSIDSRTLLAARSLGGSTWTVVTRIILPLSLSGAIAGFLLVFSMGATSLVLPLLLGGADFRMMLVLMYQQIFLLFNWPMGFTIGVVLLFLSVVAFLLASKLGSRGAAGVGS